MGLTALATEPLGLDRKRLLSRYKLWSYSPVAQLAERYGFPESSRKGRTFESSPANQT